ncbi:MAG TPA: NAD-dependent epimerase/dehydratase family protein [Candidatus Limnocylindrales bacterium]|nr:NAD-dependent epimerase/dehydratase family protein [Candidatus Limnocylindrales bacterium]
METKSVRSLYQLSGQRVFVTGASGFIGSHLCSRLCKSGAEVHAISRIKRSRGESGPFWWQGDLAEIEQVRNLLRNIKPDLIFHLASYVAGSRDASSVMTTFRNNLVSTLNLLMVVNEIGCKRIILAGSLEEPEQGDLSAVPCSPYAVAKWAGSAYARMFHALYQLPVVILRIFMVYGPAQQDLQKLIPYTILSLLRGEAPKLTSGRRPVDWIYVEDVVEGFLAAAQAAHIEGSTVDIGSGNLVSIRTLVEHLVRLINPQIQPLFGALSERPLEQIRVADTATSYALIGWKATTSLEAGLKRTVDWYRKYGRKAFRPYFRGSP